jgi:hypothetical protein
MIALAAGAIIIAFFIANIMPLHFFPYFSIDALPQRVR